MPLENVQRLLLAIGYLNYGPCNRHKVFQQLECVLLFWDSKIFLHVFICLAVCVQILWRRDNIFSIDEETLL